ncbi:hypothetical protein Agabi119p4_5432 [Agaricus bisporus var. burnettii]|uniref:Wax synthase domain-containing protein n=1 Tax=Agaricus bisporus var. burnettii TaxID=192524 RepID=A0A8H7F1L7_AGABI|nr:hypothetical protein Agabi119p4_5432 [Agaricus bisporus var. burnettii]
MNFLRRGNLEDSPEARSTKHAEDQVHQKKVKNIPGTLLIRLALLPAALWSFFQTTTRIDLVHGFPNRDVLVYINQGLSLSMVVAALRCITWSFQRRPYERLYRIPGIEKNKEPNRLWDTLDLLVNLRGHGWNWSRGIKIPQEYRQTHSRTAFLLKTSVDLLVNLLISDHLHWVVQWFGPTTIGDPLGGTIHDHTLPPTQNLLRLIFISLLSGLTVCSSMQAAYHALTLLGVGIFNQHPLQWPPMFNSPWLATSVTDYWSMRWHQLFRDIFVSVGGNPFYMLLGRAGGVMGAFMISSILHDVGLWGMGRGSEFSSMGGYFLVQGLGIILEHTWKYFTGIRVGGFAGRVWTFIWVVVWAPVIVDAWCRKGLCASAFYPHEFRPSYFTLGPLPLPPY